MKDSNGKEIRTGDFVRVSGAYFKTSNGLFLVTSAGDTPNCYGGSVWMHKVKQSGELCVNRAGSTQSLPIGYYCSDARKNREAKAHDAENLRFEVVDNVPTYYAAEHFRAEAQKYGEQAEYQRQQFGNDRAEQARTLSDFYTAVAERLAESAEQPKAKEPETGIRFYWNGIKVDGGRLIPCYFWPDENSVTISAKDYKSLPRQYFTVENNSDPYSDYFDSDRAALTPEHPLYKFARFVALKGIATGHSYKKLTEAQAAEWAAMKDPGQPTAADLAAVEEMKLAAENAKKAEEQAEYMARCEKMLWQKNEGRHFIEQTAEQHPITDGAPVVTIRWSEHPAFYSWEDDTLKISVAAAEIILRHFDEQRHAENEADGCGGYDKTKFLIEYADPETGEARSYEGRYDLGDNDGGMIAHIRAFADCMHSDEERESIRATADYLEQFTDGGRIVKVEIAPGIIDLLAYRKQMQVEEAKRRAAEQNDSFRDVLDEVAMLTDEQVEAAVFEIDPQDKEKSDVARFFLQELSRRDMRKALDVFRRWRDGAGA